MAKRKLSEEAVIKRLRKRKPFAPAAKPDENYTWRPAGQLLRVIDDCAVDEGTIVVMLEAMWPDSDGEYFVAYVDQSVPGKPIIEIYVHYSAVKELHPPTHSVLTATGKRKLDWRPRG